MKKILSIGKYGMDGRVLGKGNFGQVQLATHKLTNVKVAIKIIDTRKLDSTYSSKNLYREAKILAQLRHPNIVRLYETLKASYLYCIVLEYVPNQDLLTYLKAYQDGRMAEYDSWPLVRQLTSAVLYLHCHGIVHRDLKMDNILMDESWENIKIVDFGLSNMFKQGELLKTHCGSPEFAAPELFQDQHDYGPEVDAWSLGIIVYGMLVGRLPFIPGSTEPSKRQALLKMLNRGLVEEHKIQMSHLSIDCRSMLFQLIEPKPELRLPISELVDHSWITKSGRYPIDSYVDISIDMPLKSKVISKLAQINRLDAEYIEKNVGEYKYDSLSSQYNMLMDKYTYLRKSRSISKGSIRRHIKPFCPSKCSTTKASITSSGSVIDSNRDDDTPVQPSRFQRNISPDITRRSTFPKRRTPRLTVSMSECINTDIDSLKRPAVDGENVASDDEDVFSECHTKNEISLLVGQSTSEVTQDRLSSKDIEHSNYRNEEAHSEGTAAFGSHDEMQKVERTKLANIHDSDSHCEIQNAKTAHRPKIYGNRTRLTLPVTSLRLNDRDQSYHQPKINHDQKGNQHGVVSELYNEESVKNKPSENNGGHH